MRDLAALYARKKKEVLETRGYASLLFFYFVFNNDIHNANCRFFFFLLSFVSISNGKTQYRRTSASSVSSLFHVCVRFFDISIYTNDAAAHTVEKKKSSKCLELAAAHKQALNLEMPLLAPPLFFFYFFFSYTQV